MRKKTTNTENSREKNTKFDGKKLNVKWLIIGAILIAAVVFAFGCRDEGIMKAVSEDGAWEAYAFETKLDGKTVWAGAIVYKGDNPDAIKNVRTQRCVNGIKGDFVKRGLKDSGTEHIAKGDVGGASQHYIFMKSREEKPNSLSVKVKWKEKGKTKVEKMWLINQ